MKVLTLSVYIMNVMEQISGLDLLSDLDVGISGRKLVSGENVVTPIFASFIKENTFAVKLASLYDSFVIDDPRNDILVGAPEGIVFIGDSDKAMELSQYMDCGKLGLAGECVRVDGFPRGFWCTEDTRLYNKVYDFLKNGAPAPDEGDEAPADGGKPAEEEKPAKPAKKGSTKPAAKPAKKAGAKPAAKPKTVNREAEPADEAPEEPAPAESEAESGDEPAEEKKPEKKPAERTEGPAPTLEQLFFMTMPDREDPEDAAEETAVQTCRRLCREEGIEYDLADEE
jgi:hypothetical protein